VCGCQLESAGVGVGVGGVGVGGAGSASAASMLLGLPSRLGNVGLGLGLGLYNPYAAAQEQSAFLAQDQSAFYAAAVSVFFFKPTKNFTKKKIRQQKRPRFFLRLVWFGWVGLLLLLFFGVLHYSVYQFSVWITDSELISISRL